MHLSVLQYWFMGWSGIVYGLTFDCFKFLGYPNKNAADIALKTVRDWLDENKDWVCDMVIE